MLRSNNLRTITDMRQKALEILEYADKSAQPVFILQNSKPRGVLLGFDKYQELMEAIEDYLDIKRGEQVLSNNKKTYLTLEDFWKKNKLAA